LDGVQKTVKPSKLTHLFLVMELGEMDLNKMLSKVPKVKLSETHIVTILYNQLSALNYLHSANIIYRNLKPSNFLVDSSCHVSICDFGLARTMPPQTDALKNVSECQMKLVNLDIEKVT